MSNPMNKHSRLVGLALLAGGLVCAYLTAFAYIEYMQYAEKLPASFGDHFEEAPVSKEEISKWHVEYAAGLKKRIEWALLGNGAFLLILFGHFVWNLKKPNVSQTNHLQ